VPNRALHAALREFCLDTAAILTQCVRGGDELGFDLIEERGRASLYHYRPRTAEYISSHWVKLRSLASFEGAVKAVEPAAAAYAQIRGIGAKGGEPVLRDLVERLYEDATDFGFPEQRFELIAEELGENVGESAVRAVVIGRVHGVHLASPAIGLDDQLALAGGHAVQELPPALMDGDECLTPPEVVCVFAIEQQGGAELPVAEARTRFRRLLTGLRLMGAAGARIDSLGWTRAGQGSWRPAMLDVGASARREEWRLPPESEDELCDLLDVLGRSRRFGRLNWALARFEMGCSRPLATEALSDHLLAIRALLGGMRRDEGRLGMRLAALCAEPDERAEVRHLVEQALDLEPHVIDGYTGVDKGNSSLELVCDLEHHLRALLRDLLCGYLDEDLVAAADELLLASGGEGEIMASDIRFPESEPGEPEREPATRPAPPEGEQIDLEDQIEYERRAQIAETETQEFSAVVAPEPEPVQQAPPGPDYEPVAEPESEAFYDGEPDYFAPEPDDDADCYAGPV
jgi:hypothetical protein